MSAHKSGNLLYDILPYPLSCGWRLAAPGEEGHSGYHLNSPAARHD
jgi:hypothetical protein